VYDKLVLNGFDNMVQFMSHSTNNKFTTLTFEFKQEFIKCVIKRFLKHVMSTYQSGIGMLLYK